MARKREKRDKYKTTQRQPETPRVAPLYARNKLQQHYMGCIVESPIVVATGYPGTGKTYIPARMAATMFRQGDVENIIITRPNVSSSKSLGAFPGTKEEKLGEWVAPITSAIMEEIPSHVMQGMSAAGTLVMCPIELIKGHSWRDSFIIVDEAEDLTIKEVYKILTRIGDNSHIVLCGDTKQRDIQNSGLITLVKMIDNDAQLASFVGYVDFNDKSQIVRSQACREVILAFERAGLLV